MSVTRGDSLRVAFVGQAVYFEQCSLQVPAGGLEPSYLDFRAAAPAEQLIAGLKQLDPDVVLVFRPEIVPAGLFDELRAVTVGYLTEPLPRGADNQHEDLAARMWWLEQVDGGNFDRIVAFDPLIAETAARVLPVWRSLPIPVADSLFGEPRERAVPPRLLFLGRSTEHRERLLAPVKRAYPIVHIAHGLFGEELLRILGRTDVQLNIHNNPYPTFENRVSIAMAAAQLVVSEPLSPAHGLQAGRDFVEVRTPDELAAVVDRLCREPDAYREIQLQGRREAERFRASVVYPSLLRDAIEDVRANGTPRRRLEP